MEVIHAMSCFADWSSASGLLNISLMNKMLLQLCLGTAFVTQSTKVQAQCSDVMMIMFKKLKRV